MAGEASCVGSPKGIQNSWGCAGGSRERAGLTQNQLARKLRKPQSFVPNYERGQRRIDVLELLRIVEAFEGDPRRVFSDIIAAIGMARRR
jgi:transcriptional regulator with XRE-family HTH domain